MKSTRDAFYVPSAKRTLDHNFVRYELDLLQNDTKELSSHFYGLFQIGKTLVS